jgi:3-hydroxybutyryl-CoA dehydrogenase
VTVARVAVVGAGTMGHGIAYAAALAGCGVALTDSRGDALARAMERIRELVAGGVKRGKLTAAAAAVIEQRICPDGRLASAVGGAEVVIEAVVEDLTVKHRLFADLQDAAPADAVLATNTSSLSIAAIAQGVRGAGGVREPGRVLGLHFFNPVHAMRLVEVVTHDRSDAAVVARAVAFTRQLGKEPIVVRDSPGFASSRLGVVLGLEAMRMLEQGVASPEDIDKAMELGYNHPMGPLKLSDLVGLDVRLAIAEHLYRTLEEPQFEPPRILRDKVARGELGKKTGKGFYSWGE